LARQSSRLEDAVVTVDPVSGFKRGSHCAWAIEMLPWNVETLRRYATYLLVVVCIALLVHEIMGAHGFIALRQEKREIESLREQIRQLKDENAQLDKRIKELQSDPKAIERLARESMGFARNGETIYTGVTGTDSPKEQAPNAPPDKTSK